MVRLVHQLPRLHTTELSGRSIGRLVAPDPLRRRQQRVAAVTVFVVAIVLIAVDDDFVADLPALDLSAYRPNDSRRVGAGDVEWMLVAVERRDWNAEPGPNAVVVHAARHDVDEHFVIGDRPRRHDFELERLVGRTVPLLADHPGVHFFGHMSERRNLTDPIQILQWCDSPRLCNRRHRISPLPDNTLTQIMLHRNISVVAAESHCRTTHYVAFAPAFANRDARLRVLQCARPSFANHSRARGSPNRSFAGVEWRWICNPPCPGLWPRAPTCCCLRWVRGCFPIRTLIRTSHLGAGFSITTLFRPPTRSRQTFAGHIGSPSNGSRKSRLREHMPLVVGLALSH